MTELRVRFIGEMVDGLHDPRERAHHGIAHEERQGCMQQEESNDCADYKRSHESCNQAGLFLHSFFGQLVHYPASHPCPEPACQIERAHKRSTPAQRRGHLASELVELPQRVVRPAGQARPCNQGESYAGEPWQFNSQAAPSALETTPGQIACRHEVRQCRDHMMVTRLAESTQDTMN